MSDHQYLRGVEPLREDFRRALLIDPATDPDFDELAVDVVEPEPSLLLQVRISRAISIRAAAVQRRAPNSQLVPAAAPRPRSCGLLSCAGLLKVAARLSEAHR